MLDWNGQREIRINAVFPIQVENSRLRYEVPFGMVEYGKENPYARAIHPTVLIFRRNQWSNISFNEEFGRACLTNIIEDNVKDIPMKANGISVSLGGYAIETYRIMK